MLSEGTGLFAYSVKLFLGIQNLAGLDIHIKDTGLPDWPATR